MLFVPNPYQHFLTGVAFHFAIEDEYIFGGVVNEDKLQKALDNACRTRNE